MINFGTKFPDFNKISTVSVEPNNEFKNITNQDHIREGKWMVMFWYPKDFTFVCPTELVDFNSNYNEFKNRNCELYSASTDSEFAHLAWRMQNPDLKDIKFPMIADTSKSLAESLGILEETEKVAYRATFIVNPQGFIKWICINDLSVGRNTGEVIRVIDALQSDRLTPCNWKKGEKTLN